MRAAAWILLSIPIVMPASADEIRGKNINLVYAGAVKTNIKVLKDGRLFIAAQGSDKNCNSSGIAAFLGRAHSYVVRCQNQRPGDPPMNGRSSASFDGSRLHVTSRQELGQSLFFENDWNIEIAGRSCSGTVNIKSHAGSITHPITSCSIS